MDDSGWIWPQNRVEKYHSRRKLDGFEISMLCRMYPLVVKSCTCETICHVMEMDVCNMILGWSWQFDVDTLHKERDTIYIIRKDGRLIPLFEEFDTYSNNKKPNKRSLEKIGSGIKNW